MINLFKIYKEYNDTGFSARADKDPVRLINQDGTLNVKRTGLSFIDHFSFFHELVKMKWMTFNLIVLLSYISINVIFGTVYWVIGLNEVGIQATHSGWSNFMNAFDFSAQTLSTVGYGRAYPVTMTANLVTIFEMLVGMMYIALAAGLLFARFSRPVSKIVYSENAIIAPYRDGMGLMFRISNAKKNLLIDVGVRVFLTMKIIENGNEVRKFLSLPLERSKIDMLTMSWTIVHPIDDESPLAGFSEKELAETNAEILILINGVNDTFAQTVHSRISYKYHEIIWNVKFDSIFEVKNGKTIVSLDRLSAYSPVGELLS
jgi:inward rectifier potassium channel